MMSFTEFINFYEDVAIWISLTLYILEIIAQNGYFKLTFVLKLMALPEIIYWYLNAAGKNWNFARKLKKICCTKITYKLWIMFSVGSTGMIRSIFSVFCKPNEIDFKKWRLLIFLNNLYIFYYFIFYILVKKLFFCIFEYFKVHKK